MDTRKMGLFDCIDEKEEVTSPGTPAFCKPDYELLLSQIPKKDILKRAYFLWKMTGCEDPVKNWYEAEHQLIEELKIKIKEFM